MGIDSPREAGAEEEKARAQPVVKSSPAQQPTAEELNTSP